MRSFLPGCAQRLTASEDGADQLQAPGSREESRAQRLTASEDGAAPTADAPATADPGCSTPYGIRGWCRRLRRDQGRCSRGAQRLTASEDGAAGKHGTARRARISGAQRLTASEDGAGLREPAEPWTVTVCSTPYGIRGWCRLPAANPGRRRTSGCSTPYGIRGWCR